MGDQYKGPAVLSNISFTALYEGQTSTQVLPYCPGYFLNCSCKKGGPVHWFCHTVLDISFFGLVRRADQYTGSSILSWIFPSLPCMQGGPVHGFCILSQIFPSLPCMKGGSVHAFCRTVLDISFTALYKWVDQNTDSAKLSRIFPTPVL